MLLEAINLCASKPGHVVHDNLDDRREIYCLLDKMPPALRLSWLDWACRRAVLGSSCVHPVVSQRTRALARQARWDSAADRRLTHEIFRDLWMLDVSFRVDFEQLLRRLERAVSQR
jgi:hypothetical protein